MLLITDVDWTDCKLYFSLLLCSPFPLRHTAPLMSGPLLGLFLLPATYLSSVASLWKQIPTWTSVFPSLTLLYCYWLSLRTTVQYLPWISPAFRIIHDNQIVPGLRGLGGFHPFCFVILASQNGWSVWALPKDLTLTQEDTVLAVLPNVVTKYLTKQFKEGRPIIWRYIVAGKSLWQAPAGLRVSSAMEHRDTETAGAQLHLSFWFRPGTPGPWMSSHLVSLQTSLNPV